MPSTSRVKNSASVVEKYTKTEFEFESLQMEDMEDTSRQSICKKKNYRRNILGVVTKAKRVDFSREETNNLGERLEIVFDVLILVDLNGKHFIREMNSTKVDYNRISICLTLPKRFAKADWTE